MELKVDKKDGEENLALFGQSYKGICKGPNKVKGKSEESTSQLENEDLRKSSASFIIRTIIMHHSV